MGKILFILADGFEEIEAITTIDILRRAEINIKTVCIKNKMVKGVHGISVEADISLSEVDINAAQMIILPGGMPGTNNLKSSKPLENIIKSAFEKEIYISAICAAPLILGDLGLLKGKKAICYPGYEKHLEGALIQTELVCVDDKIITAKGAGVSIPFALKIVEVLKGYDIMKNIESGLQICIK